MLFELELCAGFSAGLFLSHSASLGVSDLVLHVDTGSNESWVLAISFSLNL